MITRRRMLGGVLASILLPGAVEAQYAPIDLGIPNIRQETPVWCWVAVAQQIIIWRRGNAPPQCALVAMANNRPPAFCCFGNPQCVVTGGLQQIQWLIAQFGATISTIQPPAGPTVIYNTLAQGRAIIMAVQSGNSGHVVVIRGMYIEHGVPFLIVNDPMNMPFMSQPIPFQQLMPYWRAAIVTS
ncbi:papain-like cysteine protease family protein [Kordiimonas sp.]|uniref:papain-like cysteine protease family protein n=1 Tax=Kordiimonas sp. TaxID=1970157 RepID=UPI003A95132F